jgi:hypothetical protein
MRRGSASKDTGGGKETNKRKAVLKKGKPRQKTGSIFMSLAYVYIYINRLNAKWNNNAFLFSSLYIQRATAVYICDGRVLDLAVMTLQCMRHSLIYFYSIGQSASQGLPLHHNNNDPLMHADVGLNYMFLSARCGDVMRCAPTAADVTSISISLSLSTKSVTEP